MFHFDDPRCQPGALIKYNNQVDYEVIGLQSDSYLRVKNRSNGVYQSLTPTAERYLELVKEAPRVPDYIPEWMIK